MKKLSMLKIAPTLAVFCVAFTALAYGQTFKALFSFDGISGTGGGSLVQGMDGSFYAVGPGGAYNKGNVFRVSPSGQVTSLYSFCSQNNCPDGSVPHNIVLGADGSFYGTTASGGSNSQDPCKNFYPTGCGTVFKITPTGKLTTLYIFCTQSGCPDGYTPLAGLTLGPDGSFYGTTAAGGGTNGGGGGTVFKITPAGVLTTVYAFPCTPQGVCPNGEDQLSGVAFGRNRNLFGGTNFGGMHGWGTLFELTPGGTLTTLYNFDFRPKSDSSHFNGFTLASDSNLYGTAASGDTSGVILKVTESGKVSLFYSFCSLPNCADGTTPFAALIQGTDSNLYGTTEGGEGTLFQITLAGDLTTLYDFCSLPGCADGDQPYSPLVQATNGVFYGTTQHGGTSGNCGVNVGCGTLFSLSMGLAPFVESVPDIGKMGAAVNILGNNLTGTTSVTFNGISAQFKVVSATHLEARIPSGATTGPIQVTTPSGVLNSNVNFYVLP